MEIAGDSAINLVVSREISAQASAQVAQLAAEVSALKLEGVTDVVPTYCSVMVCYNPRILLLSQVKEAIEALGQKTESQTAPGRVVEIPVAYGGVYGPDLEDVAYLAGLTAPEVVRIHSSVDYPIAMLGFLPGFPYLAGLDQRIHTPRLETPRTVIPLGSVGIGGKQTGIYPLDSPGGWRLIGRTPLPLFDPSGAHNIPYAAGDLIRFVPITPEEFLHLQAQYSGSEPQVVKEEPQEPAAPQAEKPVKTPYTFKAVAP